jgi:hypothetical protein
MRCRLSWLGLRSKPSTERPCPPEQRKSHSRPADGGFCPYLGCTPYRSEADCHAPARAIFRREKRLLVDFCEIVLPVRTARSSRPIRRAVRSSPSVYGMAGTSRVRGRPLVWCRIWCSSASHSSPTFCRSSAGRRRIAKRSTAYGIRSKRLRNSSLIRSPTVVTKRAMRKPMIPQPTFTLGHLRVAALVD